MGEEDGKKRLTVRLPAPLVKDLTYFTEKLGFSDMNETIRQALREFFEREREKEGSESRGG